MQKDRTIRGNLDVLTRSHYGLDSMLDGVLDNTLDGLDAGLSHALVNRAVHCTTWLTSFPRRRLVVIFLADYPLGKLTAFLCQLDVPTLRAGAYIQLLQTTHRPRQRGTFRCIRRVGIIKVCRPLCAIQKRTTDAHLLHRKHEGNSSVFGIA